MTPASEDRIRESWAPVAVELVRAARALDLALFRGIEEGIALPLETTWRLRDELARIADELACYSSPVEVEA